MLDQAVKRQMQLPPDRARVRTEQRNPRSMQLHAMSARQIVDLIRQEDSSVIRAMEQAAPALTRLIEAAEPGFRQGGRLIYLGAGTSGRLGVLDASEAPPTFQVPPGRVVGIIAGGDAALRRSSEGAEDDPAGARAELDRLRLADRDTLIGIAAGGTTPYVLGGLEHAATTCPQCVRGMLACAPMDKPEFITQLVVIDTGPEVLTGSTRMKAGTATKLALNTISTTLMVRAGRIYENLLVDMSVSNDKLRDRAARTVSYLTGLDRLASFDLLEQAGKNIKVAIVMHRLGLSRDQARKRLAEVADRLDAVLSTGEGSDSAGGERQ
jgi:N-acetylmuramic acid 6-phosphate etherase